MATGVESIRAALSSGGASASTVTTLRDLLECHAPAKEPTPKPTGRKKVAVSKTAPARTGRTTATKGVKSTATPVHEDEVHQLSGKAKYALATETVNASLKLLTDALKVREKPSDKPVTHDTPSPQDVTAQPKRPLQPRSGNATPVHPSPGKPVSPGKTSRSQARISSTTQDAHRLAAAQCAQVAFSFLRSMDAKVRGVREMPKRQLENGILALASKLIGHGMFDLAATELRAVKRCMEQAESARDGTKRIPGSDVKERSLASLLRFDLPSGRHIGDEDLCVAVNYFQQVVKLLSKAGRPQDWELIPGFLALDHPNSYVQLIERHGKLSGDLAKSSKQLEALSQTLLSFCPSVGSSTDDEAKESGRYVSPECALRLQALALRIQNRALSIATRHPGPSHDLLEPLHKCMNAFVRRHRGDAQEASNLLDECFEQVTASSKQKHGLEYFNLHLLLCSAAESAARFEFALYWMNHAEQDCEGVDQQHSRCVATAVKRAAIRIRQSHLEASANIKDVAERIAKPLTGSSEDYGLLVVSLSDVAQAMSDSHKQYTDHTGLITLAAGFAQRYARSYPGKNTAHLRSIIEAAMRRSKTSDSLMSWLTVDAASIFINGGALTVVADRAKSAPLSDAWSVSAAAVWLGRILRALTLKALRTECDAERGSLFDDPALDTEQRGAILEWQLAYLLELAPRSKYHAALSAVLPGILRTLSRLYTATGYPIRRARVVSIVFALREHQPCLIAPHSFVLWKNVAAVDETALGKDVGLRGYCDDISARLAVFKLFSDGTLTFEAVESALRQWQQIMEAGITSNALSSHIDDPEMHLKQLRSTAAYFSMQGNDGAALPVLQLLLRMSSLHTDKLNPPAILTTLTDTATIYLRLGYSQQSDSILSQAERVLEDCEASTLEELHFRIVRAEYLHTIGQAEQCSAALCEAEKLRKTMLPQNIAREQGRRYEILHAQVWLIQSKHLLSVGAPHEALAAAKQSVRVLNSIWASLERDEGNTKATPMTDIKDPNESSGINLAKGVSKLNLTPETKEQDGVRSTKGAAFWPVVPMLCQSLLHFSDVFAHHGRFIEANYYSEQAVATMSSSRSPILLSRARSHRARLLTLAGRLEEAELCLAQDDVSLDGQPSLVLVENFRARAAIKMKEGTVEAATELYERAGTTLRDMQSRSCIARVVSRLGPNVDGLVSDMQSLAMNGEGRDTIETVNKLAQAANRPAPKPSAVATSITKSKVGRSRAMKEMAKPKEPLEASCYTLTRIAEDILAEKTVGLLRDGDIESLGEILSAAPSSDQASQGSTHPQFEMLLYKAMAKLEQDVTLNILSESTLASPAIVAQLKQSLSIPTKPIDKAFTDRARPQTTKSKARTVKAARCSEDNVGTLFETARKCLAVGQASRMRLCSTSQTHMEFSRLSRVSLLQSALVDSGLWSALEPAHQAFLIDLPRSKALQYEEKAASLKKPNANDKELLSWPGDVNRAVDNMNTVQDFQKEYIDILPGSWTAVSLCLSDDSRDLYIARHRCGQQPLVLKLPFARHKPEGSEDDAFDFSQGRAELQEILDLSNYTCHNPGNIDVKGAKTKWWTERESLDRRLHELLINIENIWFGGFKAVFSQQVARKDQLSQFRKAFDCVLSKYLPSRKTNKGKADGLALDGQILELFIGLGCDDTTQDLDEPLADLLYFVVDLLQFNGERNAYDEIDFDSMVVETLDALRTHHDACSVTSNPTPHLILVLDRRLQAFPWESMPCLQELSVSRVGSMLSLRQQILAMRSTGRSTGLPEEGSRHIVDRNSGTYILNPSADLPATQAKLQPSLATLHKIPGSSWKSIVGEAPTEETFSSALKESSMLLYFGHGPGTQYIRPRTVTSLNRCSEVVWLMGCSSGAIQEYGELEPCAVPLTYLLAAGGDDKPSETSKCMAVVASLWDVTDRDIDRFSLAVGEEWGLWPAIEPNKVPAKTPRKREVLAVPSTPDQVPKTPKTPRVRKTPATSKTPARNNGRLRHSDGRSCSLVEAVSRSRDACYLRYLNGAAPVVFGVPVYLGD